MYAKLATRDAGIVLLALVLWWLLADLSADAGIVGDLTGLLVGLAFGASAFILHEWAHFLGAVASRSTVHPGRGLSSYLIFRYDTERNSRAQFLVMSVSGFVATGAVLWAYYAFLPDGLLATRIARGGAALSAALGVVLELPLVLYSLWTNELPPLEAPSRRGPVVEAP